MKIIIYSFFVAILFIDCNGTKLEKVRESDIYNTDDSDLKMNNAILPDELETIPHFYNKAISNTFLCAKYHCRSNVR